RCPDEDRPGGRRGRGNQALNGGWGRTHGGSIPEAHEARGTRGLRNMRSGVIAQKVGMTRVFTAAGEHVPVTVWKLDHDLVLAHRTEEKNGYTALQLGAGSRKASRVTRAERGSFAVSKVEPKRKLAEFRVSPDNMIEVGAEITADHFVKGQHVDVTGT